MIEVIITSKGGTQELAKIKIENITDYEVVDDPDLEYGDYSIGFVVDRRMAVGLHQRAIHDFPRTKYNVLALLLQALKTLDPKELELEDDGSSDMARGQHRALPEVQGWEG